jgi:hypothetical protein
VKRYAGQDPGVDGSSFDEVRAGDKRKKNSEGARPHDSAVGAGTRGRGDSAMGFRFEATA